MKTEMKPRGVLRLEPCTYGLSKVQFRGPRRRTSGRYVACLGGSDTFGKFIPTPYPNLIETAIGDVCVNLGCQAAGPDVFVFDTAIQSLCHDATATVIQIMSAANLSNIYYKVHPRRNDRFIAPTPELIALYPEIDFTEIAFTGHLIEKLQSTDPIRFTKVLSALEATWLRRMKMLIGHSSGPVILLWLATRTPDAPARCGEHPSHNPLFVGRALLDELRMYATRLVEVVVEHGETSGMSFAPLQSLAAQNVMSVDAHGAAAKALRKPLLRALGSI